MMVDIIIPIVAIVLIVGGAVAYIVRTKKKGQKCIGCPYSSSCSSAQKGKCTCSLSEESSAKTSITGSRPIE